MLSDVIVIDNFFDDPDSLVATARKMDYYDVHDRPDSYVESKEGELFYPGKRTQPLEIVDIELNNWLLRQISNKTLDFGIGLHRTEFNFTCFCRLHFHYTSGQYVPNEKWFHTDPTLYAGVVYLKKNPPPDTGTILLRGNGENVVIENRYNRFVMYRSDIMHSVQKSFGNNIYDSRMTLTLFWDKISLELTYKAPESNKGA